MDARRWMIGAGAVVALGLAVYFILHDDEVPPAGSTVEARAEVDASTIPPSRVDGRNPVRPSTPPVPGRDRPQRVVEPGFPDDADALRREAYAKAIAEEQPRPGEQAFRAMVSAFMEHNHLAAEAQAKAEGLQVDEVEELTFLGLMAQESQRWGEVEQVLGGPVDAEVREHAETMLSELNHDFKKSMRDLVADGGSADDRWALIHSFEQDYRERYFDITGMDEDQLDDLLAGDASRAYAPGSTPPPQNIPPSDEPPVPVPPRAGPPSSR